MSEHKFKGTVTGTGGGGVTVLIDQDPGSYPPPPIGAELRVYYTVPTPRFYAGVTYLPPEAGWVVRDRNQPGWRARFNGPNAESYALQHADRLNEEDAA